MISSLPPRFGFPVIPSDNRFSSLRSPLASLVEIERAAGAVLSKIRKRVEEIVGDRQEIANIIVPEYEQNELDNYRLILQRLTLSDPSLQREAVDLRTDIQSVLSTLSRADRQEFHSVSFKETVEGLSPRTVVWALGHTSVIQLSVGCSLGCPPCGVSALLQPRRHLSFEAIETIIKGARPRNIRGNDTILYYGSDPLDWRDGEGRNYLDILALVEKLTKGWTPSTTSAVPKGTEDIAHRLWISSRHIRISVSEVNFKRLRRNGLLQGNTPQECRAALGPPGNSLSSLQFDESDIGSAPLTHNVGLRYDFRSRQHSIACKSGVFVTPDGLFQMLPTAVTPLCPTGYVLSRITEGTTRIFCASHVENLSPLQPPPMFNIKSGEYEQNWLTKEQVVDGISLSLLSALGSTITDRATLRDDFLKEFGLLKCRSQPLVWTLQHPFEVPASIVERTRAMSDCWSKVVIENPWLLQIADTLSFGAQMSWIEGAPDHFPLYASEAFSEILEVMIDVLNTTHATTRNGKRCESVLRPFIENLDLPRKTWLLKTAEGLHASLKSYITLYSQLYAASTAHRALHDIARILLTYETALRTDERMRPIIDGMFDQSVNWLRARDPENPYLRSTAPETMCQVLEGLTLRKVPVLECPTPHNAFPDIERRWLSTVYLMFLEPDLIRSTLDRRSALPMLEKLQDLTAKLSIHKHPKKKDLVTAPNKPSDELAPRTRPVPSLLTVS